MPIKGLSRQEPCSVTVCLAQQVRQRGKPAYPSGKARLHTVGA
jgi:hypothetical protein